MLTYVDYLLKVQIIKLQLLYHLINNTLKIVPYWRFYRVNRIKYSKYK